MRYKLLAIFACILWGSAFVGAKIGFDYMPPIRLSGFRFALAGVLLWPLLVYQKVNLKHLNEHWRFMTFFAFLQTFLQYGLFFMGLNKVPAPTAAVIVGAGPLFVAVMAHFTMKNDRMTIKKSIAILLGLAGVLFISFAKGDIAGSGQDYYLGIALLILSNTIGASTNIFVAKYNENLSPVALTSFANFTGGVMLILVSLFVESSNKMPLSAEFFFVLLWLAIIPAAGFSIWYTLLKIPGVKVSELNMWKFIIPVTGCVLSWIILPDVYPDYESIIGILAISSALILLQFSFSKKSK
ncbi:MAG: DMT family transporter [Bacteroidales bacterium]|nr:DMT family transporter [Bacteroidales bacterium]